MNSEEPQKDAEFSLEGQSVDNRPLILRSESILQGRREVWIEHGDEMYRLRVTAAGKLYLSK